MVAAEIGSRTFTTEELYRKTNWAETPLGPVETWPTSLRMAVELMLPSHSQIIVFALPKFVAIYNDAYAAVLNQKHPAAFGRPAQSTWSELWADLEPILAKVVETGETYSAKDRPFRVMRDGVLKSVYFDVSFSVLRDSPTSPPTGVLSIVNETTQQVLAGRAERHFAAIVESTDAAVLGMDLHAIVTSWNEGAERLFGYKASEMVGRSVLCLLPKERQSEELEILRRIQNGERVPPHDTVRLHKSGKELEVSLTVSPIHDIDGRVVGASKIARDISQRKATERLQTLLINEMQHRVKNIILVVTSIARRSFKSDYDPDQLTTFISRLNALARSQDLMTKGTNDSANLLSLLEAVLSPYSKSSFVLQGPALNLSARAGLSFALAIHELATNAAKYGSLSASDGKVMITWTVEKDWFELEWKELGGAAPTVPEKTGFGSVLIENLLTHELGGEVNREFAPSGLICRVRAPIDGAWTSSFKS